MGGYSVECDCHKWFTSYTAYKEHCRATGHIFHPDRVGPKHQIKKESND